MDLLQQLRKANRIRCESAVGGFKHPINHWSPLEWAGAVTGEAGELANKCKKLRRGDDISLKDIGHEIGDVVIYLDLLCQRLGLNLSRCIKDKFNKVSLEVGSPEVIHDSINSVRLIKDGDLVGQWSIDQHPVWSRGDSIHLSVQGVFNSVVDIARLSEQIMNLTNYLEPRSDRSKNTAPGEHR